MWWFGLQNKLATRPHSAESRISESRHKIFKYVHTSGNIYWQNTSFVFIHPKVRFYQQPCVVYQVSNLNPQSHLLPLRFEQYHPNIILSFFTLLPSLFYFAILSRHAHCVRKYSPSTKQIFFTGFRISSSTFCNIFAACRSL